MPNEPVLLTRPKLPGVRTYAWRQRLDGGSRGGYPVELVVSRVRSRVAGPTTRRRSHPKEAVRATDTRCAQKRRTPSTSPVMRTSS